MPGREQEYGTYMDQNAAQPGYANAPPPQIDADRRSRSPGLQRNFYDTATTDFKRPYGSPPTGPEAPPAFGAGAGSAPGFPFGGLIAFLVTLAGLPIFNIGAPFWGLVFGVIASLLMERDSFTKV